MFDSALSIIDKGRAGKAVWVPFPFHNLSNHVGVAQAMYFIVGGGSGTGKTGFADKCFILHPYDWVKSNPESGIKLKVFAWKMERPKSHTITKWIAARLWEDMGILIDVPTLMSWGEKKSKVSDELYQKIISYRDYYEEMADTVTIFDGKENPTGIYNEMRRWARKNGKEYDKDGLEITVERANAAIRNKEPLAVWTYVPDDPNLLTIIEIDHYGIMRDERGFTKKGNIDKMSDYAQILRDKYGFTTAALMQFNRNIRDPKRRDNIIQPEDADFEHSSRPYQDCDVGLGILNPYKFNLKTYLDYKVDGFISENGTNRFRTVTVMKNSYGQDDINMGAHFVGENGGFYQLPLPSKMTKEEYYYYANLQRPSQSLSQFPDRIFG